jgi:hypothetical protein
MEINWYKKINECPLDRIWYNTPCKSYLKSQELNCSLYCPIEIIDASDEYKKKLAHTLCLTDENNRANFIAFSLKKKWEGDGLIYPVEYYKQTINK